MKLEKYQVLNTVVEQGSLTLAAQVLGLASNVIPEPASATEGLKKVCTPPVHNNAASTSFASLFRIFGLLFAIRFSSFEQILCHSFYMCLLCMY